MNLAIFGAPGAGKGTQSEKIAKRYHLHHISTGDLLRKQIELGTEEGKLADSYISKGNLIPDELMIRMLESELDREEAKDGVIFDGFPRTIAQAEALERMLERRGTPLRAVVGLEVPEEELVERLIERGKASGRSDDNPEAIAQRMRVYGETTSPLRDFYTDRGVYAPINGSGTIDEIFGQIVKKLG